MDYMTLMFVFRDEGEQMLLIEKKRKIGEGLWNGIGGFMEEDEEDPRETAIREVEEEVGITPKMISKTGELEFCFDGDPERYCFIFRADDYEGRIQESEEAIPSWFYVDEIPYDKMMVGDAHWLQNVIRRNWFSGYINFGEDAGDIIEWEINGIQGGAKTPY